MPFCADFMTSNKPHRSWSEGHSCFPTRSQAPIRRLIEVESTSRAGCSSPRRGRSELTTTILVAGQLADLVEQMLRTAGRQIDMSTPSVDAVLPDGSRLHVVIPVSTRLAGT